MSVALASRPHRGTTAAEPWWPTPRTTLDGRLPLHQDGHVTRHGHGDETGRRLRATTSADEALVRQLYDEYSRPLLAFVLRLTGGDRHWAEDVVQETLLRAWRNAEKFTGGAVRTLRPWLCTVARRIVIDDHRGRQARPRETDDEPLRHIGQPDRTDAVVHKVTVRAALEKVSPAHREILLETYFRDRTTQEAAQALGIPPGTVKSRVYYALRALREALREQGVTS